MTIDGQQREGSPDQAPPQDAVRYHRFISEDDPTFEEPAGGLTHKTRARFLGTRREGARKGSFRIYFTVPGKPRAPRAIELLPLSRGQPLFAAVMVKLRLGATVKSLPPENYLQVQRVKEGSHAESSGLQVGDIIRGVSLPDMKEAASPWRQLAQAWRRATGVPVPFGPIPPPRAEGNMAVLSDMYFADLYAALQESKAAGAEAVLLVERPG